MIRHNMLISDNESSVKEIIIEILSEKHPLSIKEIHNIIKKDYRKNISYQAVYKAIHELIDKKIISKKEKVYSLNSYYIEKLNALVSKLNFNYKKEKDIFKELSEKNFIIRKLNSQYEMAFFILEILKTAKKKEILTLVWPVVWPTLTIPEIFLSLKEIGKKIKSYCVCSSNCFLDGRFAKYWENLGMNLKLGVKIESMFEIFVLRDLVILIYQPPDVRVRKHRYLSILKKMTLMEKDKIFLEVLKEKTEIYAFIIKNQLFADKLRQEIMNYF